MQLPVNSDGPERFKEKMQLVIETIPYMFHLVFIQHLPMQFNMPPLNFPSLITCPLMDVDYIQIPRVNATIIFCIIHAL
jgi:hypothetical protein